MILGIVGINVQGDGKEIYAVSGDASTDYLSPEEVIIGGIGACGKRERQHDFVGVSYYRL